MKKINELGGLVFLMLLFSCNDKKPQSTGAEVALNDTAHETAVLPVEAESAIPEKENKKSFENTEVVEKKQKNDRQNLNNVSVEQSNAVIVFEAEKAEKWGFVQFPRIMKNAAGEIAVLWNMAEDNITAKSNIGWKYSKDNGKTWFYRKNDRPAFAGTVLPNGDEIRFASTKEDAKKLKLKKSNLVAKKESTKQEYRFYKASELSEANNTFVLNRKKKGTNQYVKENVVLNDPTGYRYEVAGIYNKQVWGDIIVGNNNELLKANYPYFTKEKDKISLSGVGIFSSTDNGKSWKLKSHVPYTGSKEGRTVSGFQEPAIVKMANGNILLVMRTSTEGKAGDMYSSISKDNGKTWSSPKVIAGNGVLPQLLLLKNGVLVLSSGRPGVQVRFSVDNGNSWSSPIELVNKDIKGQSSCGYTGLLELNKDEFMIVYSNFGHRNSKNEIRKSIEVKKIKVSKNG